ncbi:unnamed protein product [Arabis nemorensis]|uniref:Uncharacterized protein n=1 Tax=Arabis nemorensis TaxID=586526 RepID=A0A565C2Z0_9BRAS|nr:unnamed protein product [Arabis nemorensis]
MKARQCKMVFLTQYCNSDYRLERIPKPKQNTQESAKCSKTLYQFIIQNPLKSSSGSSKNRKGKLFLEEDLKQDCETRERSITCLAEGSSGVDNATMNGGCSSIHRHTLCSCLAFYEINPFLCLEICNRRSHQLMEIGDRKIDMGEREIVKSLRNPKSCLEEEDGQLKDTGEYASLRSPETIAMEN